MLCYLDLRQQLTYHGCGEISRGERREHPFTSVGSRKPASGEAQGPSCSFPWLCGRAIRVQPMWPSLLQELPEPAEVGNASIEDFCGVLVS